MNLDLRRAAVFLELVVPLMPGYFVPVWVDEKVAVGFADGAVAVVDFEGVRPG